MFQCMFNDPCLDMSGCIYGGDKTTTQAGSELRASYSRFLTGNIVIIEPTGESALLKNQQLQNQSFIDIMSQ